jgi:hypothetical protein
MLFVVNVLLLLAVLTIIYLLVAPVTLHIDSMASRYELRQPGTFLFRITSLESKGLQLFILGFRIPLTRSKRIANEKKPTVQKKKKKDSPGKSFRAWKKLVHGVLKTLSVKRFRASIDTGDVVLNAQLVPVVLLVTSGRDFLTINFHGDVLIDIEISLIPARVLWKYVQFTFNK